MAETNLQSLNELVAKLKGIIHDQTNIINSLIEDKKGVRENKAVSKLCKEKKNTDYRLCPNIYVLTGEEINEMFNDKKIIKQMGSGRSYSSVSEIENLKAIFLEYSDVDFVIYPGNKFTSFREEDKFNFNKETVINEIIDIPISCYREECIDVQPGKSEGPCVQSTTQLMSKNKPFFTTLSKFREHPYWKFFEKENLQCPKSMAFSRDPELSNVYYPVCWDIFNRISCNTDLFWCLKEAFGPGPKSC